MTPVPSAKTPIKIEEGASVAEFGPEDIVSGCKVYVSKENSTRLAEK